MRELTSLPRRLFGQGMGASLALTALPLPAAANGGPRVVEVLVFDFAFAPERLEIAVGDTVAWINEDLAPHTATAGDGAWDTGAIGKGETALLVFETPGEFDYYCAFHPHMTGTASVRPR